ncbi:MAG: hypothetical protein H7Y30_01530 [Pyrinomonadaceae bacterium]|nr:hypothetical protein [Pyrinomonadaceae bacterium]
MYCSICGTEATLEVVYCKRCGNVLNSQTAVQPKVINLTGPSWAMAVTIIAMVASIFGGVVNLAERGVSAVALTWMVIVGLGTIVALVAMIFRLLSRSTISGQPPAQQPLLKPPVTSELYQARQAALPEGMPSVTEHTTRTFEPAYREPTERHK